MKKELNKLLEEENVSTFVGETKQSENMDTTFKEELLGTIGLRAVAYATWVDIVGKIPEWSDVTDENVNKYAEILESESKTSVFYRFRALLDKNAGKFPSTNYKEVFNKTQKHDCVLFSLSREQIRILDNYIPQTENEKFVWRTFLIQMHTGCRFEDAIAMTEDNITRDKRYIFYTKKDGTDVTVPLSSAVKNILSIKCDVAKSVVERNKSYWLVIHSMFEKAGLTGIVSFAGKEGRICDLVTAGVAQCTFATNLYRSGIPCTTIMQYMGIKTLKGLRHHIQDYKKKGEKTSFIFD
jgi:integrase